MFFASKDGEALYSQQKLDWELIVAQIMHSFTAKFRLKLKKARKTARPFRYELNQIPYDYTVEVRNRFKGLDLIDRVPDDYGLRFVTLYRRQGSRPSPWKINAKTKRLSGEDLQIDVKRREVKSKGEKERYKQLNADFQRIARRDNKAFLSDECKEIEENNRMGKTLQENYRYQGTISCKDGHNKGQKW